MYFLDVNNLSVNDKCLIHLSLKSHAYSCSSEYLSYLSTVSITISSCLPMFVGPSVSD